MAEANPSDAPQRLRPLTSLAFLQTPGTPVDDPPPPDSPPAVKDLSAKSAAPLPASIDETPAYKKWWVWVLTGVVIGTTVALGVWAAKPSTQPAAPCGPGVLACFGDGRAR
jgi:hypothetical protein